MTEEDPSDKAPRLGGVGGSVVFVDLTGLFRGLLDLNLTETEMATATAQMIEKDFERDYTTALPESPIRAVAAVCAANPTCSDLTEATVGMLLTIAWLSLHGDKLRSFVEPVLLAVLSTHQPEKTTEYCAYLCKHALKKWECSEEFKLAIVPLLTAAKSWYPHNCKASSAFSRCGDWLGVLIM